MPDVVASGTDHVTAGLRLIEWSHLATPAGRLLQPVNVSHFDAYQSTVHPSLGQLICWMSFSVGCEYVLKGVCNLRGAMTTTEVGKKTLGGLKDCLERALRPRPQTDIDLIVDPILKTLKPFRNRDLHHYRQGVRAGNFIDLRDKVLPALNEYLKLVP